MSNYLSQDGKTMDEIIQDSNIIEFRHGDKPDAEFIRKDDYGREMYLFALSYEFDGAAWSTQVWAYSIEEAQQRVVAIRDSLTLLGQLFGEVPA